MHSDKLPQTEIIGREEMDDFVTPEYVAIAAHQRSSDSVWFIKVQEVNLCSSLEEVDDYGNTIPKGTIYQSGNFLKSNTFARKSTIYRLVRSKKTYFYKESVIFSYVNFKEEKKSYVLDNEDFVLYFALCMFNTIIHCTGELFLFS